MPYKQSMKRIGNIYNDIISIDNLYLAHNNACKGKSKQSGVIRFKKNLHANIKVLHQELMLCNYKSPEYKTFKIHEPKEREIFVLPYKDRVIQHAILQKIGGMFVKTFTRNTYSCIRGRGLHSAMKSIKLALQNEKSTRYCLKIDITKFYPSVEHNILKSLLVRKIKDKQLIKLLFEIIDGESGIPIGNYISQYFGNFYLSYFDHWLKEELKIKHVWRYCDDIVILADNKDYLHQLFFKIRDYLKTELNLEVKGNYQVFPVSARGIDFLGYKSYHTHVLIRKSIKKNYARMLKYNPNKESIASYNGWLCHANCINLKRKLLKQ